MKLNWFERAMYNFKRVSFLIDTKEHSNLERLTHAINYTLNSDDEEDYDLDDLSRLLIRRGIEQALDLGFTPFSKAFYHFMANSEDTRKTKFKQIHATLHSTEIKAINDLVAMINEYLEDEQTNHGQAYYQIDQNDLLRFFIRKGHESFRNMPIPKVVKLLQKASS
ncbi:hypothetical protein [Brevibacillus brevis]|uniref:Uncharacterized protein n=1 Tax=Brevibacillus brevis TaxID=1393 RepID=A0ABY9TEN9_BREBE|nr:hypothetical protein [Brevibacillus brevis]WNC17916.1 hypothetical protein RGB73_30135 [Brevibacillus brevis]